MQIAIKWDSGTEYLAIDVNNLHANEVGGITETRELWPETGYVYWTVQCRLEEVEGGHQVRVTYEEADQADENIWGVIARDGAGKWCGTNTIFVDRGANRTGTEGPCEIRAVDPEWNGESRWRIVGQRRLRLTRKQWQRDQGFRAHV